MFISKMKTNMSVCVVCFLFGFVYIEALTDLEFQDLLIRFSVLEEKQAFSEKRIGALETEIVSSKKRIAELEAYKRESDNMLIRENERSNRRLEALEKINELYSKTIATLEKSLSDKAFVAYDRGNTQSDSSIDRSEKSMMVHDKIIDTLVKDNNLTVNKSGHDERKAALVEKKLRATAEGIVAFSAIKDLRQEHIGLNQNIIFDKVLTNEGGGYHPLHGVFIAPQSGVYVLSTAAMTFWDQEINTAIMHNGNIIARIYGHGDNGRFDQGSQIVVLKLNVGDEVAVQNVYLADTNILGDLYSSFSGFLLSPQ